MNNDKNLTRKAGAVLFAASLAFASAAQAEVRWGDWKKDGCSKPGYRQYSSVLWDIPWGASWEMTCSKTGVTKNTGKKGLPSGTSDRNAPARCKNTLGKMWGEIDVKDDTCALSKLAPELKWGDFKKDHCMGEEVRQYSAQLLNAPDGMAWEEACAAAQGIGYGDVSGSDPLQKRLKLKDQSSLADRCKIGSGLGITTGIWGEFDVEDTTCKLDLGDLAWGQWRQDECITVPLSLDENGLPSGERKVRQYSSVLWNIPAGQSWEVACNSKEVEIEYGNNQWLKRSRPDMCLKATGNDVFRFGAMIALTAASQIKGIGAKGSVALDATGIVLDLIAGGDEIGAFNIWGVVYDADPTCVGN